jgi:DNA polymerase I-like protein with 3'-5' exonuclease and polymerase domains
MSRIAVVETKPSRNDYRQLFQGAFEFDLYHLCSDASLKKVLKRDCDIKIDLDAYDWVILVGSDALKYFTKMTSVTMYSGKRVDDKFLVVINPAMMTFKPDVKPVWIRSRDSVLDHISGKTKEIIIDDSVAIGIEDEKEAEKFILAAIAHPKPYVALDSETTGLYPRDGFIQGFSLSYDGEKGAYISADCISEHLENLMQRLFTKKRVIFHNAKFDLAFFEYHFGLEFPRFEDTMLLHYLIDENPGGHGLKQLSMLYTDFGDYEKPLYEWMDSYRKSHGILKKDMNWGDIPFEQMYTYAAIDALATFLLYEKFVRILDNKKLASVYENILIPGCRFLTDMQDNGVPFDKKRLLAAQELMQIEIQKAIDKLYENPVVEEFEAFQGKGFNPNSVLQLRTLLFDFIGLKPTGIKTGTGMPSTNAEVLGMLSDQSEIPGLILSIRQKSKIKNTYLDKIFPQLDRDSRLRTGFNLHTTTSGRLSSSGKLNMQQLPRDNPIVKGCIKAPPGHKIVAMDLTTAEMYIAAVLSGDQALMNVFRSGENFHSMMAKTVFKLDCEASEVQEFYPKQRQAAKAVSFGILYGAGPMKISESVTKDSGEYFSVGEAKDVIADYFGEFHKLRDWIDSNQSFIEQNGFIYSHFGRKRRLANAKSQDRGIKGHAIRSGLNFLVQSVASDINLLGAIDTHAMVKAKGMKARIFALVHDSILAEVPDDEVDAYSALLLECVQMDRGLSIPGTPVGCDFDVGQDYSMGKFEKQYGRMD